MKRSITLRQYCYLSMLLPIILPLLAIATKFVFGYECASPPSIFCNVVATLSVSLIGFPHYIFLALFFVFKARRMTTSRMVKHSYFSPLHLALMMLLTVPVGLFGMSIISFPHYLLLAGLFAYLVGRMINRRFAKFSYFSVWHFAFIVIATIHIYMVDALKAYPFLAIACIVYGYFYVALAHLLGWLLTKSGVIVPDAPSSDAISANNNA